MNQDNPTAAANPSIEQILKRVARFTDRRLAFGYAGRAGKAMWVMLGDDARFWVARPVDCGKLEAMGYQYAD